MSVLIGNFSLSLAMVMALLAAFMALAAVKFQTIRFISVSRILLGMFLGLLTLASIALLTALLQADMRLEYVAKYTERALPSGYKMAAFWAGQEGSLLLWAWLLGTMSTIAVFRLKPTQINRSLTESAAIVGSLAVVCGFFAALMLFAANPFKVSDVVPVDGHGLNPMLQDPGMIAHPPLLFLGYAGFTIPFAYLIGALVARRSDNAWLAPARIWVLASWLFLSIGIVLGAQWAYVELGWGGYWAWDPVENASLLPWLTGTALMHCIMVQYQRGMFKKWTAWLIAATFILCIFGTYITRSGIIDSVHAFGASLVGTFFLIFLAAVTLFSVVLIAVSNRLLKPEHDLEGLAGKEGFFLATNVLLVSMTVITLIGTIFPLLSDVVSSQKVTVGPNFYNKVVAPLGLLLAALMATGPVLAYGKESGAKLARGLLAPAMIAASAVIVAAALGLRNIWALVTTAISALAISTIVLDLFRTVIVRMRTQHEGIAGAVLAQLENSHRRYGAQIVHVGVIMMVIGVTGSSLFQQKGTFELKKGESVQFAGRTILLSSMDQVQDVNFDALQATLMLTEADGTETSLKPQFRRYNKWEEQLNSEVSIVSNWREDVYVTLAASDGAGGVTIQAMVNPVVSWIWTGGITLSLGAIVAMIPTLRKPTITAAIPATSRKQQRRPRGPRAVQIST